MTERSVSMPGTMADLDHLECPRCGAWYETRTNMLDGKPYLFPSCRHKVTANWPPKIVKRAEQGGPDAE